MKQFVENINVNGTAAVVTLVDQEIEGLIECPACENIFTAEQKDVECPYCGCRFDAEVSHIYLVVASLKKAFSKETCFPGCRESWSLENSTAGHCAIAALIIEEHLGGKICKTYVDGISHYFNILDDGRVVDATADQFANFGIFIDYENAQESNKEYVLSNADSAARYELLKQKFEKEYEEFKKRF